MPDLKARDMRGNREIQPVPQQSPPVLPLYQDLPAVLGLQSTKPLESCSILPPCSKGEKTLRLLFSSHLTAFLEDRLGLQGPVRIWPRVKQPKHPLSKLRTVIQNCSKDRWNRFNRMGCFPKPQLIQKKHHHPAKPPKLKKPCSCNSNIPHEAEVL